jgi:Protein of unknown function (DUF2884)
MRIHLIVSLLLSTACLAACHQDVSIDNAISLTDGYIAVHAPGRPDADINAAGDLSIEGNNVVVTDAQRDLLKSYYTSALALRDHGIATGEAGAKVASTAVSSVVKGLSSGNTSNIDSEVNASAAKVEAMAANICTDLQQIHVTQDALASQLDAFRPYAVIKADKVDDCSRDLKNLHHS